MIDLLLYEYLCIDTSFMMRDSMLEKKERE